MSDNQLAPLPDYSHFSDDFVQRGLERQLDISGADFALLFKDYGHNVVWERRVPCPNQTRSRGGVLQHKMACTLCHDRGHVVWQKLELRCAIQALNPQQSYFMAGRFVTGTARVTFPPGAIPSYHDRVIVKDILGYYADLMSIPLQNAKVLLPKYPPVAVLGGVLAFRDTFDNQSLVSYPAEFFKLDPNGYVTFLGDIPQGAQALTLMYHYNPELVVIDIESISRAKKAHDSTDLAGWPITAVARLDWLVRREDTSKQPTDLLDEDRLAP